MLRVLHSSHPSLPPSLSLSSPTSVPSFSNYRSPCFLPRLFPTRVCLILPRREGTTFCSLKTRLGDRANHLHAAITYNPPDSDSPLFFHAAFPSRFHASPSFFYRVNPFFPPLDNFYPESNFLPPFLPSLQVSKSREYSRLIEKINLDPFYLRVNLILALLKLKKTW